MVWEIVTPNECASLSGYDSTSYDDVWYEMAEADIKLHLGTGILYSTASFDEYYDGNGSSVLSPRNWPIISVSGLSILSSSNQTFYDWPATGYKVYNRYIQLVGAAQTALEHAMRGEANVFPVGQKNIRLQYTAGWTGTEPMYQRIKQALLLIINIYAQVKARGGADAALSYLARAQPQGERETPVSVGGIHHAIRDVLYTILPKRTLL